MPRLDAVLSARALRRLRRCADKIGEGRRAWRRSSRCARISSWCCRPKRGWLRQLSNAARNTKTVFRAKYNSLVIRRGHKKTIIALAHKLIRTIYFVLARRKPYHDTTVDHEAAIVAKSAPSGFGRSRSTAIGQSLPARRRNRPRPDPPRPSRQSEPIAAAANDIGLGPIISPQQLAGGASAGARFHQTTRRDACGAPVESTCTRPLSW